MILRAAQCQGSFISFGGALVNDLCHPGGPYKRNRFYGRMITDRFHDLHISIHDIEDPVWQASFL